jgi:hypothetical protein
LTSVRIVEISFAVSWSASAAGAFEAAIGILLRAAGDQAEERFRGE